MAKVKRVEDVDGFHYGWQFVCPGCSWPVTLPTEGCRIPSLPKWTFNGDVDKPVFGPSVLQTWEVPLNSGNPEAIKADVDRKQRDGTPIPMRKMCCHSFVGCNGAEPGQIIFLSDSTHELAGKVVDLPDVNAPWGDSDG